MKKSEGKHVIGSLAITANQAEWLKAEALRTGQARTAIIRALIEKAASKK